MLFLTVPVSGTMLTPHPYPWTPQRGRDSEACRRGPVTFRTWCLSSHISHLRSARTRFPRAPARPRAVLCTQTGAPLNPDPVVLALRDLGPGLCLCLRAHLSPGQTNCSPMPRCPHTACPPQVLGPQWPGGRSGSSPASCPRGLRPHAYPPPKPSSARSPKPPLLAARCSPGHQTAPKGRPSPSPHHPHLPTCQPAPAPCSLRSGPPAHILVALLLARLH